MPDGRGCMTRFKIAHSAFPVLAGPDHRFALPPVFGVKMNLYVIFSFVQIELIVDREFPHADEYVRTGGFDCKIHNRIMAQEPSPQKFEK